MRFTCKDVVNLMATFYLKDKGSTEHILQRTVRVIFKKYSCFNCMNLDISLYSKVYKQLLLNMGQNCFKVGYEIE